MLLKYLVNKIVMLFQSKGLVICFKLNGPSFRLRDTSDMKSVKVLDRKT